MFPLHGDFPFASVWIRELALHGEVPSFPAVHSTGSDTACTLQTLASPETATKANYREKKKKDKNEQQIEKKKEGNAEAITPLYTFVLLFDTGNKLSELPNNH